MTEQLSGIYQIKNKLNNHRYVGSSKDVRRRFSVHRNLLQNSKHDNSHLQRAWVKYGKDNFIFQLLLLCSEEDLLKHEQAHLDRGDCEYNISGIAGRVEYTPEIRAKMSVAHMGHECSVETRAKLRNVNKNPPKETRAKISAAMKGNRNALGVKRSKETKAKMSIAQTGNKKGLGYRHTDEARKKISEAGMGNKYALGYKQTDEAKAKISIARKAYWKNKNAELEA